MTPSQILEQTRHRPWPLPTEPWFIFQRWEDLLFMHWPIAADAVRLFVPRQLALDVRDGEAWITISPFVVSGFRVRYLPPVPGISTFPELNLRTYVHLDGTPGVYFFSLDAASRLAVAGARLLYALPYFRAQMSARVSGASVEYESIRTHVRKEPRLEVSYAPVAEVQHARPGSLAHWLTERYCLYSVNRGRVFKADIHHLPWPLQTARAHLRTNTLGSMLGLDLPADPPVVHFAKSLDVLIWRPRKITPRYTGQRRSRHQS